MCGIAGIHGRQEKGWIGAMNAAQTHRGPDDAGVFREPGADLALAMTRLAIIDLAGGRQPMTTADGQLTIVFNGEIYNAPELRRTLEEKGVRFATDHSDTEVVLALYAREGADCLAKLNGMFAFAVYDKDKGTLFCARDRIGIKPFYYVWAGGRFAFASEIKALLALPFIPRAVNRQSLFHYMSLMYVPGEDTIFEGIRRLAPGHALSYDLRSGSVTVARWWRASFRPDRRTPRAAWPERVRAALAQAVKRWTLSDVPVGCLLSGGLDSSGIVGLLADAGESVRTYTLGFTGPGEDDWSELELAREVAHKWGTDHHEIVLDPETLLDELPAMVWHMDEPYGGGLPSWSVFKFMGRDLKVALTGTGGDELFGNYWKFRPLEGNVWKRRLRRGDPGYQAFRRGFFAPHYYAGDADKRGSIFARDAAGAEETERLLHAHFAAGDGLALRDRSVRTDFETQLPDEFLAMTDRFSMAHSLEARTPFLDHELVETVFAIPAEVRLHRRTYKRLLRDAVGDLLPGAVARAPKRGFVIPLRLWLRGRLRPLAERLLAPDRLAAQGFFRPSFHEAYVRPHVEGRADHTTLVWGALMFQLWHTVFMECGTLEAPSWDLKALAA